MTELCLDSSLNIDARRPAPMAQLWRTVARWSMIVLGWVIIALGSVFAVLPGHIGLPLVLIGLVLVLRHSAGARRGFIRFQRSHPNIVMPIRRLIRREPEVAPVLWQQLLRTERMLVPAKWRRAKRLRRQFRRPV